MEYNTHYWNLRAILEDNWEKKEDIIDLLLDNISEKKSKKLIEEWNKKAILNTSLNLE